MNNPKVAILMSTYNGEKYLSEQILSIINQTYMNWVLYIRDDGSKDGTLDIIKKYQKKDKRIFIYRDSDNIGAVKSFMTLLKNIRADYYMFSDQDDYWLKNKVELSVHEILKYKNEIPACVYTNFRPVNRDLSVVLGTGLGYVSNVFLDIMFTNYVAGCTLILNNKLKNLLKFSEINYSKVYMHDWWIAMVAAKFGKLVYLNKTTLLYRQHGNNVVGSHNSGRLRAILNRIYNINISVEELNKIIYMASEFNSEYGKYLSGIEKEYIQNYGNLNLRSKFNYRLHLIRNYPPRKEGYIRNLFFKYLILSI